MRHFRAEKEIYDDNDDYNFSMFPIFSDERDILRMVYMCRVYHWLSIYW